MTQREKARKLRQLRSKLNHSYLKIRETPADSITALLQEAIALGDTELIFFAEIQLIFTRYNIIYYGMAKELENWIVRVEEYGFKRLSYLIRIRLSNWVFLYKSAREYIQLAINLLEELAQLDLSKDFERQCRSMLLINFGRKISSFLPSHYLLILDKVRKNDLAYSDGAKTMISNTHFANGRYSKALSFSMSIILKARNCRPSSNSDTAYAIAILSSLSLKKFDVSSKLVNDLHEQSLKSDSFELLQGLSYAFIKFYIETNQLDKARILLNVYRQRLKNNQEYKAQFLLYDSLQGELLAAEGNYRMALRLNRRHYHSLSLYFEIDQMVSSSDLRTIVDLITEESLPDYYLRQSRRKRMAEIKSWLSLNQKLYHHFVLNGLNDLQSSVYLGSKEDQLALTAKFRTLVVAMSLTSGKMWHSLKDEIKLLWMYRELMVYKYGFSPELQVDVPDDLLEVGCPYFLLQGVMENAFKHGYNSGQQRFVMQLHVRLAGNTLHITFTDNGEGNQQLFMIKPAMIGLSTNRQRMEMLSAWTGVPAGIDVIFASAGQTFGTSVLMQLPRLSTPCGVADYHLALCKKDQQKFSRSHAAVS